MRHQQPIYDQSDIFVRNKAINNVNMSSDFCIFKSPTFDVQGATKVHCNTLNCVLTGYSFTGIVATAITGCYGTGSTTCYISTTWSAKVIADGNSVYEGIFYTTTNLTGDTPSNTQFINAVEIAYNTLGYDYTLSGNVFSINKPYGVKNLELDVCVSFLNNSNFSCPVGFSATPANDACVQITVTAATFNGSGATILAGNQNAAYANYGTYFYPSIQNNSALPVFYIGNFAALKDQTGGTITALNINNTAPFWGNPLTSLTAGRLNNISLSAASGEYVGFTKCINISVAGTYYVALAADNNCKFTVNGKTYAVLSGSVSDNFKKWSVFPFHLNSGKNIIEMYGENDAFTSSAFAAEIYDPLSYATLTGATSTGSTQANSIFTTAEFIGGHWQIGTTMGYTCPAGFALDGCGTAFTCTKIVTTGATNGCTGSCLDECTMMCSQSFDYIDYTSVGVYTIDDPLTSVQITFNFTGDTSIFTGNNASFKYEIYKFNPTLNIFTVPPVYRSSIIPYTDFNTNILTQNIPMSGISLDGDYLIKGYFEANTCTDYLSRLGKRIDTVAYRQGSAFQLYDSTQDYYFVAVTRADVPTFTPSSTIQLPINNTLPLFQQVIVVDDINPSGYTRTGSTFTLDSEYIGDIIVTLDGFVLAPDIDYTLVANILTFVDPVTDGDVITIIYTKSSVLTIVSETISVGVIPSGITGNQGASNYYYNTTTGKYEIYTQNQILQFSSVIVVLNEVILTNSNDYYQSISDPNRIIMNGIITNGDTIIIVYYPVANVIAGLIQNNNIIAWNIEHAPQLSNGLFNLQYDLNNAFSSYTISDTVVYEPQITSYTGNLILTGTVDTHYFYRVQNIKQYRSICGDIIGSTAYSETVEVVIETNSINSY